jgi:hypothetical protein
VFPRIAAALTLLAASPLLAQPAPFSLCIVQTKADASTHYDPSAGPWAIEMNNLLSTRKLRNNAPLHITVLAASTQKEVLPEVHRLHCPWVVQLWYQHNPDLDLSQAGVSSDPSSAFNPQLGTPPPVGTQDSLFFSLWNGVTKKVIARGAVPLRLSQTGPPSARHATTAPCATLTQQILKRLNQLP